MLRAVQGATNAPLTMTWKPTANLTGATVTGKMTQDRVTFRSLTGALSLVTAASGIFSWDCSDADLATPGVWEVQFTAVIGSEAVLSYSDLLTIEAAFGAASDPAAPTPSELAAHNADAAAHPALDARLDALESGGGGGGAVDSVNGETGVVVLSAIDVGADAAGTAAAAVAAHEADTTNVHGIADTAALATTAAVAAGYQPLDSDLTAIAALSTTSYGRSLLALADAAALRTAAAVADGRFTDGSTNYYLTPGMIATATNSTLLLAANTVNYAPFVVKTPITIDQIAIEVTGAVAAAGVRVAIYNADTNGQPTSLVVDSGKLSGATTGVKTASVSVTLQSGRYLAAVVSDSAITLRCVRGGNVNAYLTTLGQNQLTTLTASLTYGAFPSTGTAWTAVASTVTGWSQCLFLRVSVP